MLATPPLSPKTIPPAIPAPKHDLAFEEVLEGLTAPEPYIPCKYFYDGVGSRLFERITHLPEYYPTRTEIYLLSIHGKEIAGVIGERAAVIEYGSGSSRKTDLLLDRLQAPAAYVPIDISEESLRSASRRIAALFPEVAVRPVLSDYTRVFTLPPLPDHENRVVFFPGSTIGNFTPDEAVSFLARMRYAAGEDGGILIGVDLKKDASIIERAYNDKNGVTASFNLNVLRHLNRRFGANFDLDSFRHRAFYNPHQGRIEMHLESCRNQYVRFGDKLLFFRAGETIHTENSYKYAPDEFNTLARRAGLAVRHVWIDPARLFSIQYLHHQK